MRDGPRKVAGGLLAALLMWAGGNRAQAQNGPQSYPTQAGYGDGAQATDRGDILEQMQRRLDAQEGEIRAMRAQQQAGAGATPISYAAMNAEAADLADPKKAPAGPKEVPIYTGPKFGDIKVGAKAFMDNVIIDEKPGALNAVRRSLQNVAVPKELNYTGIGFMRLYLQGNLYENVDFKFEIDLANGIESPTTSPSTVLNPPAPAGFTGKTIFDTIAIKDVYSTIKLLPIVGNIRVGHFKEPFQLDELTGDEDHIFFRRSLDDSFAPARKWGLMAFNYINENKDLSYYLGSFRDGGNDLVPFERSNEGDYDVCTRLVWLPYYDEPSDGRYLVHTGFSYRHVGAPNSATNPSATPDFKSFNETPEAQTLNPFLQTGNVPCDTYDEFNPEFAAIWGPLTVESEATWVRFNGDGAGGSAPARTVRGAYVQAAYMLTGENHGYDRELKRLGPVKPYEPFFRVNTCDGVCWGKGAWEVAARYSMVDLNDTTLNQGEIHDCTLALNWYLNNYCRVWFDYVHSEVTCSKPLAGSTPITSGDVNLYEMRFSYSF